MSKVFHHAVDRCTYSGKTNVQSYLANGRIANLSPFATANWFVRCWPWFVGPTGVRPQNGISIGSAVFARLTNVTNRQTHIHTDHATPSVETMHLMHWVLAMRRNKKTVKGENNNNMRLAYFIKLIRCRPNWTYHYWPAVACCALVSYVAYAPVLQTSTYAREQNNTSPVHNV